MKTPPSFNALHGAVIWTALSAGAVVVGWGLSLCGQLQVAGYGGALLVVVIALFVWRRRLLCWTDRRWRVRPGRWRRIWPAAFLLVWSLALLGGLLYAPSNIDALTYRLPRVLHWLVAGRWHWLDGDHLRMNYNTVATEWLYAPILAMGGAPRWLVLIGSVSVLLLPGLLFVWLRQMGASGKAAWRWMWLTPCGLVFALQAGSLGNDVQGATYGLAALVFAGWAAATGRTGWWVLSCAAIGLATNVKASNIALVPMWLMAAVPAWRSVRANGLGWLGGLVLGCAVSAGPTLVLNAVYSGHWSGDPANLIGVRASAPIVALSGNALLVAEQNLAPPFFPWAGLVNGWTDQVAAGWSSWFSPEAFPRFTLRLAELPREEWAGLGLGCCLLLAYEWWLGRGRHRRLRPSTRATLWLGGFGGCWFGATLASEMPARLLAPFYFVAVAMVAAAAPDEDFRRKGSWRVAAAITAACAMAAVVLTPARPLFPAAAVWNKARAAWPGNRLVERAARVYAVYAARPDPLESLRDYLPAHAKELGFLATDDDSEWSLWLPRGSRRVIHLRSLDSAPARTVDAIVLRGDAVWPTLASEEAALHAAGFRVATRQWIWVKASRPPERWLVVLRDP